MMHKKDDRETVIAKLTVIGDLVHKLQVDSSHLNSQTFSDSMRVPMPELRARHLSSTYVKEELVKVEDKMIKDIVETFSPVDDTLFFFVDGDIKNASHQAHQTPAIPSTFDSRSPPLPTPIKLVVTHIFYHVHSGMWQFDNKYQKVTPEFVEYEPLLEPPT